MNNPQIQRYKLPAIVLSVVLVISFWIFIINRSPHLPSGELSRQKGQYKAALDAKQPSGDSALRASQKKFVTDFYTQYLTNKQTSQSQETLLDKFGTDNLAVLYSSSTDTLDLLTCSVSIDLSGSFMSIGDPIPQLSNNDTKTYLLKFLNARSQILAAPQVTTMLQPDNSYLIDKTACPGGV